MIDAHRFVLFVGAALALLVTPGPAVLYVVSSSMERGTRAGVAAALGLMAGGAVHMLAALAGVAALLAAAPSGLAGLRLAGGLYFVYLAWKEGSAPPWRTVEEGAAARHRGEVFRGGFVVSLLNPNSVLFFLAFLPQFVDPAQGDPRVQLVLLATCFFVLAFGTDTSWAVLGGRAGRLLRSPAVHRARRWISAGLYAALGLAAVLQTVLRR